MRMDGGEREGGEREVGRWVRKRMDGEGSGKRRDFRGVRMNE
jgi:hypothetical protein